MPDVRVTRDADGVKDISRDARSPPDGLTNLWATGIRDRMLIYKILRANELADLVSNGQTEGAPIDVEDGFVHLSTGDQVEGTLAKHFKDADGLSLLAVEANTLGDELKWEVSRGGSLFPHLYRVLRIEDVVWHKPLTAADTPSGFTAIWV